LIRELVLQVEATHEPSKVTDCGNPDDVITRKNIPIGFIQAKGIGNVLKSKTYKKQFERYHKESVAFETTLSGRRYLRLIKRLRDTACRVEMIYLAPPSVKTSTLRVAERVQVL